MQVTVLIVIIPIVAIVALASLAGGLLLVRRRRAHRHSTPVSPPGAAALPAYPPAEPPPMTDLESALATVTDSTGRPIRDRIDAESGHVDELRVADDTGPLLRRALDHVSPPTTGDEPAEPSS